VNDDKFKGQTQKPHLFVTFVHPSCPL